MPGAEAAVAAGCAHARPVGADVADEEDAAFRRDDEVLTADPRGDGRREEAVQRDAVGWLAADTGPETLFQRVATLAGAVHHDLELGHGRTGARVRQREAMDFAGRHPPAHAGQQYPAATGVVGGAAWLRAAPEPVDHPGQRLTGVLEQSLLLERCQLVGARDLSLCADTHVERDQPHRAGGAGHRSEEAVGVSLDPGVFASVGGEAVAGDGPGACRAGQFHQFQDALIGVTHLFHQTFVDPAAQRGHLRAVGELAGCAEQTPVGHGVDRAPRISGEAHQRVDDQAEPVQGTRSRTAERAVADDVGQVDQESRLVRRARQIVFHHSSSRPHNGVFGHLGPASSLASHPSVHRGGFASTAPKHTVT